MVLNTDLQFWFSSQAFACGSYGLGAIQFRKPKMPNMPVRYCQKNLGYDNNFTIFPIQAIPEHRPHQRGGSLG
jgi:hypothetical protein